MYGALFGLTLMIENTSWEGGGRRGGWKWKGRSGASGGGEGVKECRSEAPAPAPAQTTLQGIRAHPGSRMVSLKNFSNHF